MQAMGVGVGVAFCVMVACSSCMAMGAAPPMRKNVVVYGSVYCLFCVRNGGTGSLSETALLPGAVVKLQCNNTNKGWEEEMTTGKDGSFLFTPKKVSTWGAHKCKVFLISSPRKDCPFISSLNGGDSGALLIPTPTKLTSSSLTDQLYTVGPFAFNPDYLTCL